MELVVTLNCEDLKNVNPIYYEIRRDLFVTPTNCLVCNHRLLIPNQLKWLVPDSIHYKHPGQVGKLALAKEKIPKSQLGTLPKLVDPNQEKQKVFAAPSHSKNTQNNYILVTVDRLSGYPQAETFHNCHTKQH